MAEDGEGAKAPAEVKLDDLVKTFGLARKLAQRLAESKPFQDADLQPEEWTMLNLIAEGEQPRSKLARELGISGRDVDAMARGLTGRGLAASKTSAADPAKRAVEITADGRNKLDTLNAALLPMLQTSLKDKEQTLTRAWKALRTIGMAFASPEELASKEGKKGKKDADGD